MRRPMIATCLVLAGCGSSHATTTTVTTQHTVTTKPSTTAKPASDGVAYCSPKALGIHYVFTQGAAGTLIIKFAFVNVTSHPCRLHGYPGVSALTASGRPISLPVVRRPSSQGIPHVTVQPGQQAGFTIATSDQIAGPCHRAAIFRFIPPNDYAYEQIAHRQVVCRSIEVTAVGTR